MNPFKSAILVPWLLSYFRQQATRIQNGYRKSQHGQWVQNTEPNNFRHQKVTFIIAANSPWPTSRQGNFLQIFQKAENLCDKL